MLNSRIWQSRLRRSTCIVWLPPIDRASPSPVMIHTSSSGLASLMPGREGRRAAVDRVEAVGRHVIRKAARAADAADEHRLLARDAEVRHRPLHGLQHRIIAAARAPADLLVARPVLGGGDGLVISFIGTGPSKSAISRQTRISMIDHRPDGVDRLHAPRAFSSRSPLRSRRCGRGGR